jgi:hypothetical protein
LHNLFHSFFSLTRGSSLAGEQQQQQIILIKI